MQYCLQCKTAMSADDLMCHNCYADYDTEGNLRRRGSIIPLQELIEKLQKKCDYERRFFVKNLSSLEVFELHRIICRTSKAKTLKEKVEDIILLGR